MCAYMYECMFNFVWDYDRIVIMESWRSLGGGNGD